MNPLDMVIITIIGFCLIRGLFRGLIKELSSIIGVFGGFYAAYTYYPVMAQVLAKWIANPAYLNLAGFVTVFVGVFIAISLVGLLIKYLMSIAYLGWIDKVCGTGFGVFKGTLIASVLIFALTTFLPSGAPSVRDSMLAPYVTLVSEKMSSIVSSDMKKQYRAKMVELKRFWNASP